MFEKHTRQSQRSTEDVPSVRLSEEIVRVINTHERPRPVRFRIATNRPLHCA